MYDKAESDNNYYTIYKNIGEPVKATSIRLREAFLLGWYNCSYGYNFDFVYEDLQAIYTKEDIRLHAITAAETIVIRKNSAFITLYNKEVSFGSIKYLLGQIKTGRQNQYEDYSESELLEMLKDYYKSSCYYKTMTGQK